MGTRCKLADAAKMVGLSEWELRTGALSGKYPFYRIGGQHGRMIFDIDLVEERIQELMKQNMRDECPKEEFHGIRRVL